MTKFLEVSYLSHVKMHQNKSDYHTMNGRFLQEWFIMAIIFLTFFYRIVDIWNNLPSEIKLRAQCLNNFKHNLRKYLVKDFLRRATPSPVFG